MDKFEVFGVIWMDTMLGPLTLNKPSKRSAIDAAASMRQRGVGKIIDCHAVHLPQGSDELTLLD